MLGSILRALGRDSPVTVAVFTRSAKASTSRQSAGTRLPSSSSTMSPGTRSVARSSTVSPPRLHLLRQQLAQRRHRALGFVFLPEGKNAVDDDDTDDRNPETGHALARIETLGDKRQRRARP